MNYSPILTKLVPLLATTIYVLPFQALATADATSAPASAVRTSPEVHLSWVGERGKAYTLAAVPPPPAPGSDKEKADLDAVLKAQSSRTPDEIKEAMADQKFSIELMTSVIGPDFTPGNYPVAFDFLKRVHEDEGYFTSVLKAQFKRNRPYQDHSEVRNLFPADSYSYPSGRASAARMMLLILAELFPDKTTALLNREEIVAESGVKAGVDYPSDIVQGRNLATTLLFVLQGYPAYMDDMAKAKAEIAARKRKQGAP